MGETTSQRTLRQFCNGIQDIFGREYLRKPNSDECQRFIEMHGMVHHFPGMLGRWNKDINVLQSSHLFNDECRGEGPAVRFVANGTQYNRAYYLADGIYPRWPVFVKTIRQSVGQKQSYFAAKQEDDEGFAAERWALEDGASTSHGIATAPLQMGVPRSDVHLIQRFTDMRRETSHTTPQADLVEEIWNRREGGRA
ncbi:uncharacterized protein LOC121796859 [Salvia splendens]|uniref:uncharacterized protein LOC121796859 n=1 Tax=Salvia splendens TaxID=180675 RepID=UPI001C2756A0|nr:uncharacterized protein LOC121796859 [Salvia splendens]